MIATLRAESGLRPGLAARVDRRHRTGRSLRWVGGSLGVASVAAASLLLSRSTPPPGQITFAVDAPTGSGVSLVGDFNGWQTGELRLAPHGDRWELTMTLPPGRYRFAYVTDGGTWLADPTAAPVADDFGRPTSVLTVASH